MAKETYSHSTYGDYDPLGCSLVSCGSQYIYIIFFEVAYLISFQTFLKKVIATAKKIKTRCGPCPSWVHSVQITILSC